MNTSWLTCTVSLLLCSLGLADAARAEVKWGANGHPLVSYPDIEIEEQLALLKGARMTLYRVDVPRIEHSESLGELIDAAKERGIQVVPVLQKQGDLGSDSPEELHRANYEFARRIVTEHKGQVPVWELGNELESFAIVRPCETMDDGRVWNCKWGNGEGDATVEYVGARWAKVSAVLRGLSEGTAAADPKARRAMGTAGWGHTAAFDRLVEDGVQWDISVWHWYSDERNLAGGAAKLAVWGKPIWITEFNFGGGSQKGERQQADGLRAMMATIRKLARVYPIEAAMVYELLDEPYHGPHFEAVMGLVRVEREQAWNPWHLGEGKPAFSVVKQAIARRNKVPEPSMTGTTELEALHGNRCIEVGWDNRVPGKPLWQSTCTRQPNQLFEVTKLADGFSRIRKQSAGLCMAAAADQVGAAITQERCSEHAVQRFKLTRREGTVRIQSVSGLCVGPPAASKDNGVKLQLVPCSSDAWQRYFAFGLY